jgi:HSP20 family protein
MEVTHAKSSSRPWWMTPFGREPLGDIYFDRLWPEWQRDTGEEVRPSVDLVEKDNEYLLTAELPGFEKGDISVSMDDGYLTINGKREEKSEVEDSDYHVKEIRYGSFSRSFMLPKKVIEDNVDATFNDGILKVVIPHVEDEKTKKIEIH